jgi:hypothetical protein
MPTTMMSQKARPATATTAMIHISPVVAVVRPSARYIVGSPQQHHLLYRPYPVAAAPHRAP